jgi:hypothetical protein
LKIKLGPPKIAGPLKIDIFSAGFPLGRRKWTYSQQFVPGPTNINGPPEIGKFSTPASGRPTQARSVTHTCPSHRHHYQRLAGATSSSRSHATAAGSSGRPRRARPPTPHTRPATARPDLELHRSSASPAGLLYRPLRPPGSSLRPLHRLRPIGTHTCIASVQPTSCPR